MALVEAADTKPRRGSLPAAKEQWLHPFLKLNASEAGSQPKSCLSWLLHRRLLYLYTRPQKHLIVPYLESSMLPKLMSTARTTKSQALALAVASFLQHRSSEPKVMIHPLGSGGGYGQRVLRGQDSSK